MHTGWDMCVRSDFEWYTYFDKYTRKATLENTGVHIHDACARARARARIYIYIFICICNVCLCACPASSLKSCCGYAIQVLFTWQLRLKFIIYKQRLRIPPRPLLRPVSTSTPFAHETLPRIALRELCKLLLLLFAIMYTASLGKRLSRGKKRHLDSSRCYSSSLREISARDGENDTFPWHGVIA